MKITINVDCTPEEARRYMGLPDVGPIQEAMLKEMQERIMGTVHGMQPEEMMKAWFPPGVGSWLEMQKAFWGALTSKGESGGEKPQG